MANQHTRISCSTNLRSLGVFIALLLAAPVIEAQETVEERFSASAPLSAAVAEQRRWAGPGGTDLPFTTEDEILDFLRTAEVVGTEDIDVGVTRPVQVTLEKDGVRARAIFHDVDVEVRNQRIGEQFYFSFHDSYRAQCAAYALARLLGLRNVPPTVCRAIRRRYGSLQLWIEGALTEGARAEQKLRPPDFRRWTLQLNTIRLFDALLFNDDRNAGNILIDPEWVLWMIDHTRAFQQIEKLLNVDGVILCERDLWQRLQTLGDSVIEDSLSEFFEGSEIRALLKRRELLVARIQGLIDAHGEDRILFSWDDLALR